MLKGKSEQH